MNDADFVESYIGNLRQVLAGIDKVGVALAIDWLREARESGNTVYSCGNGGSASIGSQMVVDVVKGGSYQKAKRFKMMSLTDSVATITAYANDIDYETVFVEPLQNFMQKGDILIAISGSGNSSNVLRAVEYANQMGRTIGLTSAHSGRLRDIAQLTLMVPTTHMGWLEDCFFVLTHVLCYRFIEER